MIWASMLAVLWVAACVFVMALAVMAKRGDEQLPPDRERAEATPPVEERFSRDGSPMRPRARSRP